LSSLFNFSCAVAFKEHQSFDQIPFPSLPLTSFQQVFVFINSYFLIIFHYSPKKHYWCKSILLDNIIDLFITLLFASIEIRRIFFEGIMKFTPLVKIVAIKSFRL